MIGRARRIAVALPALLLTVSGFVAAARAAEVRPPAPTPAATWSGVRLRQSHALGESGHISIILAIISYGGLFRTAACKKVMPLKSSELAITLSNA